MVIQSSWRRVALAVLILVFASLVVTQIAAQHIPSGCKDLTSDDWEWWFRQCYMYEHSDPSPARVTGFIFR